MQNILIVLGHPTPLSFNHQLAQHYATIAKQAGANVEVLALGTLDFDPILRHDKMPLEPDVLRSQELIKWADHLVFFFPVWWGTLPALLKGWLDRTLMSGFAFQYEPNQALPTALLKGRTASIIATMDSPWWWYWLKHGRAAHRALRSATLDFIGIKTTQQYTAYKVRTFDEAALESAFLRVQHIAQKDARITSKPIAQIT